jgi:polyisoprenoid-binding protein YceI
MTPLARILVPALLALTVAGPALAQTVVPGQSEIAFSTRQMGVPVDGHFRNFNSQVRFDPRNLGSASVAFTIDLASARIGTAETEAELAKPDWFNTKAFPQATFRSTGVKALGGHRYEVAGQLAIKGTTRDVVVPVTLTQAGATTTAQGQFTLKRLDFRIGDGDWKDTSIVANDVGVRFKLALTGVPAL